MFAAGRREGFVKYALKLLNPLINRANVCVAYEGKCSTVGGLINAYRAVAELGLGLLRTKLRSSFRGCSLSAKSACAHTHILCTWTDDSLSLC